MLHPASNFAGTGYSGSYKGGIGAHQGCWEPAPFLAGTGAQFCCIQPEILLEPATPGATTGRRARQGCWDQRPVLLHPAIDFAENRTHPHRRWNRHHKKFQKKNEEVGRRGTPATKATTSDLESFNRLQESFNRKDGEARRRAPRI